MDISEFKKIRGDNSLKRHPWEIARGKIIIDLIRWAKKGPVTHVTDVGCGDGYITNLLSEKKMADSYSAFDNALDTEMRASLEKRAIGNIRFFSSLQDKAATGLPKADILLILDVLEHVPDETIFLTEIKRAIRTDRNTKWIITVPAFQSIFSHHDILLGHFRRYRLRQLKDVCEKNNLTVDRKGYFFFSLLLIRIIQNTKQKDAKAGTNDTIQGWNGSRRLTSLFTLLLGIDYKIGTIISNIGINIPGLSCYCICHQLQ